MPEMLASVVETFAHGLGMTDYRWADDGAPVVFAFEQRGTLSLEAREEALLVYLVRPFDVRDPAAGERLSRALALCHYRHNWPFVVQTAVHGQDGEEGLLFLARLPRHEATPPALEQALDLLTRLHAQVADSFQTG